jgi:AraC-like DNA-binding protein
MACEPQDDEGSLPPSGPSQIINAFESEIQCDHGDRPLGVGDFAQLWRHANFPEIELFHGSYQNYQFARHFHRVVAIGIVDRGAMSSYCRRGNHIVGTGTVILLNPGEIHAPAPAGTSGWGFRMIYVDEAFLRSISGNSAMRSLRFKQPFVQDRELASTLFQLHFEMKNSGDRLRFEPLLISIFSQLAERHLEGADSADEPQPDKTAIDKARQYLEANYRQNLSVGELARHSPYGASHFLRMFRESVGLTPHAYLTQYRIELATSLLRSGMSLVDIANIVGFTDQSHFTKKFKRILGITPGQYKSGARVTSKK